MSKIKQIFTNRRVIILIIFLLFFTFMIGPRFDTQGVAIRSIVPDSAAAAAIPLPLASPLPGSSPNPGKYSKA